MDAHDAATSKDYESDEPDTLNEHWNEPGDPDGVFSAERKEIWHKGHVTPDLRQVHAEPRKRRWPIPTAILGIIALIVGAYFLGMRSASIPLVRKAQVAQSQAQRKPVPTTTVTRHYDSSIYTLGFDFPQNWILSDTKDKLTITSPSYTMQGTDGSTPNGHVVVTIQNQQPNIAGFPDGGATASLGSAQLTYKNPSPIQRKQSYLTFLGYKSASGTDVLYLTGDYNYQTGDNVAMSEIARGNPLISVTFVKCTKSYCAGGTSTPLTLVAGSWDGSAFKPTVVNLLQSLVLH